MAEEIRYEKGADDIVTLTFDSQGQSANTMNAAWVDAMHAMIDRLEADSELKGIVLASAKKTFFAGGSTVRRWAAATRSAWAATAASSSTTTALLSASPRSSSVSCPAPAAACACPR